MATVKRIVCLANSIKNSGRCLAGREILENGGYGGWIRPVSGRATMEVSLDECRCSRGMIPRLLDILDVPLREAAPHGHQTENYSIEPDGRWVKAGELPWDELERLRQRPASIWISRHRTNMGAFDCVSQMEAETIPESLLLLFQKDFIVEIGTSVWDGKMKRSYRGKFDYLGTNYNLSVTDPVARSVFSRKKEGDYPIRDVYICVSLTEAYEGDGRCHKLVAAILTNPPL